MRNEEKIVERAVCGKPPKKDLDMIIGEKKIRELLGRRFHLSVEFMPDGMGYKRRWVLYRRYADTSVYLSEDNKPIMSSETNTDEELLDFAKRHRLLDYGRATYVVLMIWSFVFLLANILNIVLYNTQVISKEFHDCLFAFILGGLLIIITMNTVKLYTDIHNNNVEYEEIKQYLLYDKLM